MAVSRLKQNIAYQYALQIAIYVYPFITLPFLTRVLGPDVFAVRAYSISIMSIAGTIISYGFNAYGIKVVAEAETDKQRIEQLTALIMALRLCLAIVTGIVIFAISFFIPIMAENMLYMVIAYVGICLGSMLPDFIFEGLQDMSILAKRFVGSKTVSIILILAFIRGPEDIVLVAIFESAASVIAFVWSWMDVFFKRKLGMDFSGLTFCALKECFRNGTTFFLSTLSNTMISGFTTIMIGIFITDDAQISYWSLSMAIIAAVQTLYSPITYGLYPHVVASHDMTRVKKYILIGLPVMTAVAVAFWLLSNTIMLVLGGTEYVAGAYVIRLASPIIVLTFPIMMIGYPVLAATGHVKQQALSSTVAVVFNAIGLIVLAAMNIFSIQTITILRVATEFVLMALSVYFALKWRKNRVWIQEQDASL